MSKVTIKIQTVDTEFASLEFKEVTYSTFGDTTVSTRVRDLTVATQSAKGLMAASDRVKLDAIPTGGSPIGSIIMV